MKIRSAISDFRSGLSILFGKPKKGEGDRKLAKMCAPVEAQIPAYGKHVVRLQIIKSIEGDLKRAARKGQEAVDALLDNALGTPEYVAMLHKLDLDESFLRVMAMTALKQSRSAKPNAEGK